MFHIETIHHYLLERPLWSLDQHHGFPKLTGGNSKKMLHVTPDDYQLMCLSHWPWISCQQSPGGLNVNTAILAYADLRVPQCAGQAWLLCTDKGFCTSQNSGIRESVNRWLQGKHWLICGTVHLFKEQCVSLIWYRIIFFHSQSDMHYFIRSVVPPKSLPLACGQID